MAVMMHFKFNKPHWGILEENGGGGSCMWRWPTRTAWSSAICRHSYRRREGFLKKSCQGLLRTCLLSCFPIKIVSYCHSVWQWAKKWQSEFQETVSVSEMCSVLHTQGVRPTCWAARRKQEKQTAVRERHPVYLAGSRFREKNALRRHSKQGPVIRMEKAVKSIWLLQGICLYILIASSFSFISSGTWLPNERIDYLSWMHISQLKAIKACKISTTSRSTSGF